MARFRKLRIKNWLKVGIPISVAHKFQSFTNFKEVSDLKGVQFCRFEMTRQDNFFFYFLHKLFYC